MTLEASLARETLKQLNFELSEKTKKKPLSEKMAVKDDPFQAKTREDSVFAMATL